MELEPWIETYSGKKFYFLNPTEDMVDIRDIARSLSLQCRFLGHISRFYSVAEHSINVGRECFEQSLRDNPCNGSAYFGLYGLLHDASEAYLMDIPSPIKQHLSNYHELEAKVMKVILSKFGITSWDRYVEVADKVCLKNEARQLLPSKGDSWIHLYPTPYEAEFTVNGYTPDLAMHKFLFEFNRYTGGAYEAKRQTEKAVA